MPGAPGPNGAPGTPGAKGATGAAGSNGANGATGPGGSTGSKGATGAAGVSGWQWIARGPISLQPGGSLTDYSLFCPIGQKVLGGGYQTSSAAVRVTQSYPQTNPQSGWTVTAQNGGTTPNEAVWIQATCASVG